MWLQVSVLSLLVVLFCGLIAWLFFKQLKKPDTPFEEPQLPKPQYIDIIGRQLCYYQIKSKKPTLVFLHGIGASSYTWRYQIQDLKNHFQIISLDLSGFGNSEKNLKHSFDLDSHSKIVETFLLQLKCGPYYIVGSSMGATIALDVCRRRPDLISKLIVVAPAVQPNRIPPALSQLQMLGSFFRLFLTDQTMRLILKIVLANHERITDDSLKNYLQPYRKDRNSVGTFIKSIATLKDKRLPKLFSSLRTPTLILYGQKDPMVHENSIHQLKSLTGAELKTHKDLGHHLHEDNYQWTNTQIKNYFKLKS